jgi:hypothetical protein
VWQWRHSKALEKRRSPRGNFRCKNRRIIRKPRDLFKNHFAGFAIRNLRGVGDARADFRRHHKPVNQDENRLREIQVEQRFRRGELKDTSSAATGA